MRSFLICSYSQSRHFQPLETLNIFPSILAKSKTSKLKSFLSQFSQAPMEPLQVSLIGQNSLRSIIAQITEIPLKIRNMGCLYMADNSQFSVLRKVTVCTHPLPVGIFNKPIGHLQICHICKCKLNSLKKYWSPYKSCIYR